MNETAELARKMAIEPKVTVLDPHQKKLERILDREVVKRDSPYDKFVDFINECYELGFRVIVKPSYALRFKYGASILGNCVGKLPEPVKVSAGDMAIREMAMRRIISQRIAEAEMGDGAGNGYSYPLRFIDIYRYAGDIPEFTLNRMDLVKSRHELPIISVHSQEPLPIVVEKVPPRIEPVAIWWAENPEIGEVNGKWKAHNPDVIGAVIAIWDRDKEIPILEG